MQLCIRALECAEHETVSEVKVEQKRCMRKMEISFFSPLIALHAEKGTRKNHNNADDGDVDDEQPLAEYCVNKCLRMLRHYCTSQFVKYSLFLLCTHTHTHTLSHCCRCFAINIEFNKFRTDRVVCVCVSIVASILIL